MSTESNDNAVISSCSSSSRQFLQQKTHHGSHFNILWPRADSSHSPNPGSLWGVAMPRDSAVNENLARFSGRYHLPMNWWSSLSWGWPKSYELSQSMLNPSFHGPRSKSSHETGTILALHRHMRKVPFVSPNLHSTQRSLSYGTIFPLVSFPCWLSLHLQLE